MLTRRGILQMSAGAGVAVTARRVRAASPVLDLSLYYPVAIGGSATKIVDGLIAAFEAENPDIKVHAVYAGGYPDTLSKALTAFHSGVAPELAIMQASDMFTLVDAGAVQPIEPFIKTADDKAWLGGFSEVYMQNSRTKGMTWGIPFQRGTTVFFWNKDAFKEAGLDPEAGPQTWDDVVTYAKALTRRDSAGEVSRWGMQVPSSLTAYWLLQGYAAQNGATIVNAAGDRTAFDAPEVVEALQYWVDLSSKHKVMRPGVLQWASTPKDFFEGRTAMFTTTSGNLTNVKDNSPVPFGVQILPGHKRRGAPTSGGNIYVMAGIAPEKRDAAFRLVRWLTSPERAADWSIKTGYVAPRGDAWETDAMKAYVKAFPAAAVARSQIPFMVPELSTHENQKVARLIDNSIEAALTGARTPAQAMQDAQAAADRVLQPYRA